jgi:beta-fructofuranosidase
MNRRGFLSSMVGAAVVSPLIRNFCGTPALASELQASLSADPRRPQFHLLPAANWMNDPNAPIYFEGNYHLFYQYNPNGAYWGDMHWGHAISSDMIHWRHLPVAFAPTPDSPDADGCFTGSAVIEDGSVVVMYTGVRSAPEDEATIKDGARSLRESQCLATASDPELKRWTKLPAAVIPAPPAGLQVNGFRDPSPWRQGEWWYAVIGSGIANVGGAVLLYRSKDLRSWEYVHVLAGRNQNASRALDPFDPWEVWECPDFFPLGDKHVLIYSTAGKAWWQSGTLDMGTMRFHAEQAGMLDHGSFYAPKSQVDRSGNRILWGWIPETRSEAEYKASGWAGVMSLPRVLSLGRDGRVMSSVVEDFNQLRGREQKLDVSLGESTFASQINAMRVEAGTGEILCNATRSKERFALALESEDGASTWLRLEYDPLYPDQLMIDARALPVYFADNEKVELQVYIDGSVIELFVNRQAALTKRVYPRGTTAQDMRLKWIGKTTPLDRLSVWRITPISGDRLTR